MPPTKEYLLNQVKTGNVVHWAGKRCRTEADVEAAFAATEQATPDAPSTPKKPSASKLPPAKKDAE